MFVALFKLAELYIFSVTFYFLCLGLSIPVPRGRKGKRVKAQSTFDVQKVEWIRKYNPDTLLLDDSYRKHLKHQCNKSVKACLLLCVSMCNLIHVPMLKLLLSSSSRVLLRVRMLYYLKQEVIGEHADSVLKGADIRYLIQPIVHQDKAHFLKICLLKKSVIRTNTQ